MLAAGSLAAGLAGQVWTELAGRALQGIGAALIAPPGRLLAPATTAALHPHRCSASLTHTGRTHRCAATQSVRLRCAARRTVMRPAVNAAFTG
ncbi:hypothetical protein ACIOHC_41745 [Streptomyces sp. NPDC088252]|uniref:hypothetical protein n=1 Tax=Streptomyces sp. NPDC088252 TaxID=3365845 RepID=UPI003811BAD1